MTSRERLLTALRNGIPDRVPVASDSDSDWSEGEALVRRDHFADALPKLGAALARLPDNADLNSLMGFTLRKLKRYDESERHYQKALASDPDHRGAREYYGELLLTRGDIAKAREQLRVLERLCPTDCEELRDLQAAFQASGAAVR